LMSSRQAHRSSAQLTKSGSEIRGAFSMYEVEAGMAKCVPVTRLFTGLSVPR
jgi:hypothetical protein